MLAFFLVFPADGLLLCVVGGVVLLVVLASRQPRRYCPRCMSRIHRAARVCPHCMVDLPALDQVRSEQFAAARRREAETRYKQYQPVYQRRVARRRRAHGSYRWLLSGWDWLNAPGSEGVANRIALLVLAAGIFLAGMLSVAVMMRG